jgi:hypothetical protein
MSHRVSAGEAPSLPLGPGGRNRFRTCGPSLVICSLPSLDIARSRLKIQLAQQIVVGRRPVSLEACGGQAEHGRRA